MENPRQTDIRMTPRLAEVVESLQNDAIREGGQADCLKLPEYIDALKWMQDLGYVGIEAEDDNKFYYVLLSQHGRQDLAAKVARDLYVVGGDPLHVEAVILRMDYEAQRRSEERRVRLRRAMEAAETAPTPEAPKKNNDAGVIVAILVILAFAIYLTVCLFK